LNITIPYEETEPKQLMVENIAITNNDKEEQNITKSKTTESIHAFSMMPVSTIFAFYGRPSVYCSFTILTV
jgi:hypothetical protein